MDSDPQQNPLTTASVLTRKPTTLSNASRIHAKTEPANEKRCGDYSPHLFYSDWIPALLFQTLPPARPVQAVTDLEVQGQVEFRRLDQRQNLENRRYHRPHARHRHVQNGDVGDQLDEVAGLAIRPVQRRQRVAVY